MYAKPSLGLIEKNEHAIVLLKYVPPKSSGGFGGHHRHAAPASDAYLIDKCPILLNYMPSHQLDVGLVGSRLTATLRLENDGVLYFAPTCKNKHAYRQYEITNATPLHVAYEWKIPYECKDLFSVDELQSVLHPFEKKVRKKSISMMATFKMNQQKLKN